ncbi:MAG: RDD family protein [Bdellovibrionaceae bacterium]|nr:RDD family protein [Pseudobdellovibrionaceae bacterium]
MVIENTFLDKKQSQNSFVDKQLKYIQMAKPVDRFAAAVIDIISVVSPLILLLTSPMKKQILETTLLGQESEMVFWFVMSFIATFLVSLVYQTFFTYVYGATLGKMIFKLKVVNVWTHKNLSFSESLFRGFTWNVEALLLFIPTMGIMSHQQRRAFHDIIGESQVVCLREGGFSLSPTEFEKSFVKGVFSSIVVFFVVFLSSQVMTAFYLIKDYDYQAGLLEEQGDLCSSVGKAANTWPNENKSEAKRLSVAISLYSSGEISKDCLEQEADFAFSYNEDLDLANLAKAFVYSQQVEVSDAYLERICNIDSNSISCKLSKNIENWDEEGRHNFIKDIKKETPVFYKLWVVRDMVEQGEYRASLKLLNSLGVLSPVSSFVTSLKSKSYFGLNKIVEADLLSHSIYENSKKIAQMRISKWKCYNKLADSCTARTTEDCAVFTSLKSNDEVVQTGTFLTSLKLNMCSTNDLNEQKMILKKIARRTSSSKNLQYLNLFNNKSKIKLLNSLGKTTDEDLNKYTLLELVKENLNNQEMAKVVESWRGLTQDSLWHKIGNQIYNKSIYLNKSLAYNIGIDILEFDQKNLILNKPFYKQLVVLGYSLKKYKSAWDILKKIPQHKLFIPSRNIASTTKNYDKVKRSLSKRFGQQ